MLLTNSDTGGMLLRPLMRRLLEVVFDGKPEAVGNVDAAAANFKAEMAKERERLVSRRMPELVGKLARRYQQRAGGPHRREGRRQHGVRLRRMEEQDGIEEERRRDSLVHHGRPDATGLDFVVGERSGKRVLVIRDGQHEYVFTEG